MAFWCPVRGIILKIILLCGVSKINRNPLPLGRGGCQILAKAVKGYRGTAWVSYPKLATFLVDPSMVLDQTQLEFREGYGCCGLAFGGFHCPSCKKILGRIFLDCYQLNRVEFFQGQVELTCKE